MHALPNYLKTIHALGTTDNFTTQMGKLEHKRPKAFFSHTSKNSSTVQIVKHKQCQYLIK
ncbi:hypothetical protein QCA50_009199 [Cerrena zonata]|uniref:Uncharacterized protein n=1 Tax=Cerrena zonata TaxID=2478898 RepID=A0AAW0GA22_9APHY